MVLMIAGSGVNRGWTEETKREMEKEKRMEEEMEKERYTWVGWGRAHLLIAMSPRDADDNNQNKPSTSTYSPFTQPIRFIPPSYPLLSSPSMRKTPPSARRWNDAVLCGVG